MMDASDTRSALLEMCGHLYLDLTAESVDPNLLPFMAPPEGAPPYHGFGISDVEHAGFRLGLISSPFTDAAAAEGGDGFVVAPDGSRAGLVWKVDQHYVFRTVADSSDRWGVWLAGVDEPMSDLAIATSQFARIVGDLRPHWEAWADQRRESGQ